jgi:hypothetical protein
MPRTTRDDEPPVEPPPTDARDEFAELHLTPRPPGSKRTESQSVDESGADLFDRSEAELLGMMSRQHFDPTLARDAWSEMYRRHARYVAAVVSRAFGEFARDEDALADIVSDAFRAVFDWAGKRGSGEPMAERFAASDRDGVRSKVLGFHAVVARNIAARKVAVHTRGPREFTHGDIEQVASAAEENTEPPPATERSKLDAVLELLSSEEAEALRVSLPWYQVESGEFSFPRGEAARVAASLGISPEALRQRRSRSLRRLQSLLGAK